MKNKHLTLEERIIIEEYLEKGISIHRISLKLGRPDSSIVREIKRNRFRVSLKEKVPCVFRNTENCTVRHLCGDQEYKNFTVMLIICTFTQQIEHLGLHHCHDKIKCSICIGHDHK